MADSQAPTAGALSDAIITAVARMVDDAQQERRVPAHSDLTFLLEQAGLKEADLSTPAGKEKRIRHVLTWAMEHDMGRGEQLVARLVAMIRGFGGFRPDSPNYVGRDAIENARDAFTSEGLVLTGDGELHRRLLEGLDDPETPRVLRSYIRRANRGADDAALVVGTSKDLLEATAAHVLLVRFGSYTYTNFPLLLGQAFVALGLATAQVAPDPGEPPWHEVERRLFDLGCAVNRLRNKEGIGHGRPFLPSVSDQQARAAIQAMGVIAQLLLDRL
ncbi:MAG: abortive infection family protein [Actinomycetota bacterium]|nr:abortive infection family protein [Actinomycetota bacterium]